MVALKARDITSFLTAPHNDKSVILIYGPNSGLIEERVDGLIQKYGIDKKDDFSYQRYEANALTGEKTLLVEEAHSIAMFGGGMRLIHVRGNTSSVTAAVTLLLNSPPVENRIIIEAGDLPARHGLRSAIEKSKIAVAIPCYADDERSLAPLVTDIMKKYQLHISPDARTMALHLLGNDRAQLKSELEKLALACLDKQQITIEDVQENLMDASTASIDDIVDMIFKADHKGALVALTRYFNNGGETTPLVLGLARGFYGLSQIVKTAQEINIDQAVEKARPPIFFKRKAIFKNAARLWDEKKIAQALSRIAYLEKQQRSTPLTAHNQITRGCLEIIQLSRRV